MDLIGGVGQMPVKLPAGMTQSVEDDLPQWLQNASEEQDKGKTVAERFLQIEQREQKRMQKALSGEVVYNAPLSSEGTGQHIQIAGIEKGSKNRYNNIWPYEHTRVKLEGVDEGSCDYVNANHVQAAYSNKRYIATQGPIPATFKVGCSYMNIMSCTNSLSGLLERCMAARRPRYCHVDC
jgi:protein-tyrosine phosphatase